MTSMPADPRYQQFIRAIRASVPDSRILTDPLRTLAFGTDASFYRLIPKIVVKADTENEVVCPAAQSPNFTAPKSSMVLVFK